MKNIARKLSALLLVFVVSAAALCPAFAASASLPELPKDQCVVCLLYTSPSPRD